MAKLKYKDTDGTWKPIIIGSANGEVQKTTEAEISDMGFTKNQGTITEVKMNGVSKGTSGVVDLGNVITEHQDISGKVDKVSGKLLSTEDFTTTLKQKLEGLNNYNDAEINAAVQSLQTQLNTLVSGNANDAINSFNEIIAFLDGISDSEDLDSIIASIEQQIANKQDNIIDLDSIRSGASLGATAVQPSQLSSVATSGSYNDLTNKPTIPNDVTESTVSGWGFTKNTGTYTKPSTGIPKTDLSSAVQTSLGKADTALQSYTETDPVFSASAAAGIKASDITNWNSKTSNTGTVTGVKINGSTKNPSNGVVDLGTVITSHQDISNLATKTEVNNAQTAAQTYADNAVAALVNGAPETLDTLDELALALKDNKDIVDVLNQSISNKQDKGNYVTTDTEQTITGKKYINDSTFRFKNSENTIETVVTNRAISMQPMDGVEKPSSTLSVQSMTGGKLHITNANSKNQTVWPKQLSITNLKYDTQDRCGVYIDSDENRQLVIVGYFKNVNGVFYTLASLSTGKYVEIMSDCLYLHSGASSDAELNAAAFKWDSASNMLHLNRKYYDGLVKDGNVYAVVNTTGGNGGYSAIHHTHNTRGQFALKDTGLVIAHSKNNGSASATGKQLDIYNWLGGNITLSSYDAYGMTGWGGQIMIQTSKMINANTPGSSVSLIMRGYEQNNVDESFTILGAANYVNKNLTHIAEKVDGHRIGLGATKLLMHGPVETEADQNAICFDWDNTTNTLDIKRAYYNSGSLGTGDAKLTLNGKKVATIANIVNHGTSDSSFALTPNTYHVWGTMSSLTLTLSTPEDTTVYNEYMFEFTSGSTATTLSLPSTIKWANAPSIEANKTYQVSIVNNLGVIAGFAAI